MSNIPPTGGPYVPPPTSSPDDQEGQDLYNSLEALVQGGQVDHGSLIFLNSLLSYINQQTQQGSPLTYQNMETWVQNFINQPDPKYPNADIYMYVEGVFTGSVPGNLTSNDLPAIISQLNTVAEKYGNSFTATIPSPTVTDASFLNLAHLYYSNEKTSFGNLMATVLKGMYTAGSNDDGWSAFTDAMTSSTFFSSYPNPPITLANLQTIIGMLPQNGQGQSYQLPDFAQDYLNMGYGLAKSGTPAYNLAESVLTLMQSTWTTGNLASIQASFTQILLSSNLVTNYPNIQYSDIQTVAGQLGYQLPDFTQEYLNISYGLSKSGTPAYDALAGAILAQMQSSWSTGGTLSSIQTFFTNILINPSLATNYPGAVYSDIQAIATQLNYQLPNFAQDYITMMYAPGTSGTPAYNLTESVLKLMQSNWTTGSLASIQQSFAQILTDPNLLKNYPGIQYSDIQTVASSIGYTLPSYAQTYFNSLTWEDGLTPTDPNLQLATDLTAQIRAVWQNNGSFSTVTTWAQNVINSAFANYSTVNLTGATELESLMALSAPALQDEFFQVRALILASTTSAGDVTALTAFQTAWTSSKAAIWPSGSLATFTTWFNTTFATDDFYMQYPTGSAATLETVLGYFSITTQPKPTSLDAIYVQIYQKYGSEPATDFYPQFLQQCLTVGSADTGQAIEKWLSSFTISGFMQSAGTPYPDMTTPSDVLTFLGNFSYNTGVGTGTFRLSLDYMQGYIANIYLNGIDPSSEQGRFASEVAAQIYAAEVQTNPSINSLSDLQTYLNTYPANYATQFPDLPASTITALFAFFGLTPNYPPS